MNGLLERPNPILDLFRSKIFWQEDHGIAKAATSGSGTVECAASGLHYAVACSVLAHDVVATAWLEIHELPQPHQFLLRLYAMRWQGEITCEPSLLLDDTIVSPPARTPRENLGSLCARFDRLDISKEAIFLRDHEIIADPQNAPYPKYWKQFPWTRSSCAEIQLVSDAA